METRISQTKKSLWTKAIALILLISAFMLIGGTTASAAEINKPEISAEEMAAYLEIAEAVFSEPEEGFEMVSEVTTLVENDSVAVIRIYEKEEPTLYSSTWTYKTYQADVVFIEHGFEWVYMCVWGRFGWNGETTYLSGADGYADTANHPTQISITSDPPATYDYDCGSNALWGNKYAYVQKKATATNGFGTNKYTFELVVNRNGSVHTNPSYGEYWEA